MTPEEQRDLAWIVERSSLIFRELGVVYGKWVDDLAEADQDGETRRKTLGLLFGVRGFVATFEALEKHLLEILDEDPERYRRACEASRTYAQSQADAVRSQVDPGFPKGALS